MISRTYGTVGQPTQFKGKAYDFGHRVTQIQFSLDEGEHWTTYPCDNTNDYQNVTWTFTFTPQQPGLYQFLVRSVNERGDVSPEAASFEFEVSE